MSKVFFPLKSIDIPASPPHDGNPSYRVSRGIEHWADGSAQLVYKVQMAYGGNVHGRKSPSYPENTDDLDRVLDALKQLRSGQGKPCRGEMTALDDERGLSITEVRNLLADRE